ncbi:RNA guanine-N7 methyltransferase activating subunit [Myripristis murdjan]|uniref:RNA guanine-7 methyltransferase activating subunit n=1 Tax=Myripristis murdjan TaxID=586833 RepID=A0A667XFW0_9TELE|nr:RNA guanine-N7 methyltransferase activating subunit [Myripristis murdjan]
MTEPAENSNNYEELFAHRFSSEDREYQQYVSRPADPPPVVEDWRGRGGGGARGRDNRYQERRGHRGRGWGRDRSWGGEYREQHYRHDRDRSWGHGSGQQSGHSRYNQGYNSYNQRPHYNRY